MLPFFAAAAALITAPQEAKALTTAEILAKLRGVPAFVLADSSGQPLTVSPQSTKQQASGAFMDRSDADLFLQRIRK
jgi:hypothetical protein